MAKGLRFVSTGSPLVVGTVSRERGTTWVDGERGAIVKAETPTDQLGRVAWHASNVLGATGGGEPGLSRVAGQIEITRSSRVLTDADCQMIYQRCSDVRASINSVSWRVATNDWEVRASVPVTDPEHELALELAAEMKDWLEQPNADDVWQEVWTAVVADALKFPAGVLEIATEDSGRRWRAEELVPVRGANFHPVTDEKGRVVQYIQRPWVSGGSVSAAMAGPIVMDPENVVYVRIAATTESREPVPLLEALIYEICSIMQGNEMISKQLNSNEVPEGILVLIGLSKEAGERAKAQYTQAAGQPWKLRVITSPDAGQVDAKWVEFRKTAREQQVAELVRGIRRAVWRTFGVMPVEMGETDATPRATAEVQVDAGGSHLITPFLDLLETKINREILPRRVERPDLIEFVFKRSRDLTPAERVSKATELSTYVKHGIISRNTARARLPEPELPVAEGDVLTVGEGNGTIPLSEAIRARGDASTPEDAPEPENAPDDTEPENAPPDDGQDDDPVEEDDETGEAEMSRRPGRIGRARGARDGWAARALRGDTAPAAWSASGPFKGTRTLPLSALWDEMVGYQRDILPAWEGARAGVIAAVSAHYRESGFDSAARSQVEAAVNGAIAGLLTHWTAASRQRYRAAAESARVRASGWVGVSAGAAGVQARADRYHVQAMGYLAEQGGLLADVRERLMLTLLAVTDLRGKPMPVGHRATAAEGAEVARVRRARRAMELGPQASLAAVLQAVANAWDSAVHRIGNWSGKLTELASAIASDEVVAGSGTGKADGRDEPAAAGDGTGAAVDWWCEWASVGDEASCETCLEMGSAGYMRVADLRVYPGGAECRSNCRCVLVYWTKNEIDGGQATLLGGGNTGRQLSRVRSRATRSHRCR